MRKKSLLKTILTTILSITLLAAIICCPTACKTDDGKTDDTTDAVTTEAPQTTIPYEETTEPEITTNLPPLPETEKVIELNSATPGIKILGVRNLASDKQINADWTCSGIEFDANCKGEVTFTVSAHANCYYRVYVDGVEYKNGSTPYFTVGTTITPIKLTVEEGIHRFTLMKVTGYTLSRSQIHSVTMTGYILEEAPVDKELYIEFVGDSITCGWGTIGTYDGAYTGQDGTLAFSYLTAKALDADYSMTALSGQGILCGSPGVVLGYKYACYNKSTAAEYDFARKADMVVINIGTNDYSKRSSLGITETSFYNAFRAYVSYVRQKNGENCVILAVYNMMNDTFGEQIKKVFGDLGGNEKQYYTMLMPRNTNTNNTHPSIKDNAGYAVTITEMLKSIKDGTYKSPAAASKLPTANSVVISPDFASVATGTEKTFVIDGKSYTVTVGVDAFSSLSEGVSVINPGGTIYLGEGTYSSNVQLTKDITILGPKAGIDPNVKGANAGDAWTLSSSRGTGEAKITGQIGMGVWNDDVYSDCHNIVIDGVMLTGGYLFRANNGLEGYGTYTLKNIYIADVTQTNYPFYFSPYYPRTSNPKIYRNTLILENVRIEGAKKTPVYPCLTKLAVSGLYMSETCSVPLLEPSQFTAASITGGVDYSFENCMFRGATSALNLSALSSANPGLSAKEYVKFSVEDCVFATAGAGDMIKIALDSANSSVSIKNNTFIKTAGFSGKAISDTGCASADYSTRITVSGNKFVGLTSDAIALAKSTAPVVISDNTYTQ